MVLIDTGFLLALANTADALHARAMGWAGKIKEPQLVTEYVLWETINSLSRKADRLRGHRLIALLRANPRCSIVEATPELFESGLALHAARADKEWSLTDCISFLVMSEKNISRALTHDEHFRQAGFSALLRDEPK